MIIEISFCASSYNCAHNHFVIISLLWAGGDLNPQELPHTLLRRTRLPISPPAQLVYYIILKNVSEGRLEKQPEFYEKLLGELIFLKALQEAARKAIKIASHERLNRGEYNNLHREIGQRRRRLALLYKKLYQ